MVKLRNNIIYQFLYEIIIIILPLITAPYISRVLGAEKIGIYSFTYSIANYFVLFANLGIKNYGNRTIAKVKNDQKSLNMTFSEITVLHLVFSIVVFFAYILFFVVFMENDKTIAFIQGFYVLGAVFDINWFYFGMEEFKLTVVRNSIVKILTVLFIFVFVNDQVDLWKYTLILATGTFVGQSLVWIFLKKYVSWVKPSWDGIKPHIKPMIILFLPVLALSLYKYMDKIMLGYISSKTQGGYYENAEKIINIPMSLITAFGTVLMPRISNMISNNEKNKVAELINNSMVVIMILSIAIAFGLAGISGVLAPVFFGSEFIESGVLIAGLSITIPIMAFANVIRTQYLVPYNEDRTFIVSLFVGAIVNLIINALLISQYNARGVVVGTIAAEIVVCIYQTIAVKNKLPVRSYIIETIPYLVFGIIMFVAVYFIGMKMGTRIATLVIQIITGVVIYALLTLVYLIKTDSKIIIILKSMIVKRK